MLDMIELKEKFLAFFLLAIILWGGLFGNPSPLQAEEVVLSSLPVMTDSTAPAGGLERSVPSARGDQTSPALRPAELRDAGPPVIGDGFSAAALEEERSYYDATEDSLSAIPRVDENDTSVRIVIDRSAYRLYLLEGNALIETYPVALGRTGHRTPLGACRIISKLIDPHYVPRNNPDQLIPPGPENPVGTRWLGLSWEHYGIHGTNNPSSIGRDVSLGCIRMTNEDVEELFKRVAVGTHVEVIP